MTTSDRPGPVFNLDTFQDSLTGEPYHVTLGGDLFVLTHLDLLDAWEVVDAFLAGEAASARNLLKLALGPVTAAGGTLEREDRWDDFRAKRLRQGGLKELVNRYLRHCGVEVPN